MKTAISIPNHLFEAAESRAKQLGISRSEFYATAVAEKLQAMDDESITDMLNSIYADDHESSQLDQVLQTMQFQSLPEDDWA